MSRTRTKALAAVAAFNALERAVRKREASQARARDRREEKRSARVGEARDAVLDALDEETEKLAWAAERDLLTALLDDIQLRLSDNHYRSPKGRKS